MAHARRKSDELWANHDSPIGKEALDRFQRLYQVEEEAPGPGETRPTADAPLNQSPVMADQFIADPMLDNSSTPPADRISLRNGTLSAEIAIIGAELTSFRHGNRELLWQGQWGWWTHTAPLLFPIIGRLHGGSIKHEGRTLHIPTHGFARGLRFEPARISTSFAEFSLRASPETMGIYPFDFELRTRLELTSDSLVQQVQVTNRGSRPMPASLGFHPAFSWPVSEPRRSSHFLSFSHPEFHKVPGVAEDRRSPRDLASVATRNQCLAIHDALFADGTIIFNPVRSNGLVLCDEDGPIVELMWTGCGQLGIWSMPGAPFVCIEPWQGWPSSEGSSRSLADKPGLFVLNQRQTRTFMMRMQPPVGRN